MGLLSKIKSAFSNDRAPGKAGEYLKTDVHSHLIPGIDDGAQNMAESIAMVREIASQGVDKIITTPHIMYEFFRNTPEIIENGLDKVREELHKQGIEVELTAAAEYYLDDAFIELVKGKEKLLTFGQNMVLVETNYIQEHPRLKEILFDLKLAGYKPVFAHPERYLYLNKPPRFSQLNDLFDFEVLFQVNLLSYTGYYGPQIKATAEYMLNEGMIHMVGSDIHKLEHAREVNRFKRTRAFEKLVKLELMNNAL